MSFTTDGDPRIESWLESQGVVWDYIPRLPVKEINITGSRDNAARRVPINKDLVEQYALAWIDGDRFPPLIAADHGAHGLILIDGNHRHQAAIEAGVEAVGCYVIRDYSPSVILRLTLTANIKFNGDRPDRAWMMAQAKNLVNIAHLSVADAARQCLIKPASLHSAILDDAAVSRYLTQGLNPYKSSHEIRRLVKPIADDAAFRGVVEVQQKAQLGVDEIRPVVRAVHAAPSEAKRLEIIQQFKESLPIRQKIAETREGKIKPVPSQWKVFKRFLDDGLALARDFPTRAHNEIATTEQLDYVKKAWSELDAYLCAILDDGRANGVVSAST